MSSTPYLFGDTDLAAQRLQLLAEVFAESTTPFLQQAVPGAPHLALDLGCGPGFTTHLLDQVLRPDRLVGLDNAQRFIARAQQTTTATVSFQQHDVTVVPFPVGPADLIFCRLLLTHLSEPASVIVGWAGQLRPGGLMLLEEVEWIETSHAVFGPYLDIVEAFLRHQGYDPYVGRALQGLPRSETLIRRESEVRRLRVANHRAAAMFALNAQTWRTHPFITTAYSSRTIAALQDELASLAHTPSRAAEIEWGMRQLVLERT